jgi:FAD/FMN-containing dehydrogenase
MGVKEKMGEIVGQEKVLEDPESLLKYSEDESFISIMSPRCIVKPNSMEEIQKIIQLANKTGTPLVPISSGGPHFRGDTVPNAEGAFIVDLNGMDRILRIDPKNKVAMIEPGVTFGKLKKALMTEGLGPYMPLVPRATKSVLTSYIEREPITIPKAQWDNQDPLLCVEVVYGSGDLFRTGSAAGPGTPEEQWKSGRAMMRGNGPTHTDFTKLLMAAQGTMGIITWATVKCRVLPVTSSSFMIASNDLSPIVDTAFRILWRRIGDQILILKKNSLAWILSDSPDGIKSILGELPTWILVFTIDGTGIMPEERIAWQEKALHQEVVKFDLKPQRRIGQLQADRVSRSLSEPSGEAYWKMRYKGSSHDIFFLTTLDQTPRFIEQMYGIAKSFDVPEEEIGVYLQPTIHGANCHCEFHLPYNPENDDEVDRIKALDRESSKRFADSGGFFSRPYGNWAKVAYSRDPASVTALRKVNHIFDPNGIMNSGKLCLQ